MSGLPPTLYLRRIAGRNRNEAPAAHHIVRQAVQEGDRFDLGQ